MHLLQPVDPPITDVLAPYQVDRRPREGSSCWVLANMVGTLDGSAALGGRVGQLSQGADTRLFLALRSLADVVLVGAETVRRERYGPVRLDEQRRDQRRQAEPPPIAVLSRSLQIDWGLPLFTESVPNSRPIVITCGSADGALIRQAGQVATVIVAGEDRVDLSLALDELAAMGHQVVLCEGGPTLLGQLAAEGLLDELCLSIAPLMGGDPLPLAITPLGGRPTSLELRHTLLDGDTLLLRYEVDHG